MKRILEEYGLIVIVCIIALAVFAGYTVYGKTLQEKSQINLTETAENVNEEMITLAEGGYYPYLTGVTDFTVTKNFKGEDGVIGFTKADALSEIDAYEYAYVNGEVVQYSVDKSRIKVYPFDESEDATEDSGRKAVDVTKPGRFSIKYVLESKAGLICEYTVIVLVDYLPEGVERQNEGENL